MPTPENKAEEPKCHWTDGLWGRQIREAEMRKRDPKTTPLPWRWLPRDGQFIVGPDHEIVAEIPCQGCKPADGKLIVTAVNERPALLAENQRLREALETIRDYEVDELDICDHGAWANKIARAALNPPIAKEK